MKRERQHRNPRRGPATTGDTRCGVAPAAPLQSGNRKSRRIPRSRLRRKTAIVKVRLQALTIPNSREVRIKTPAALASSVLHEMSDPFSSLLLEAERLCQAVAAEDRRREYGGGATEVGGRVA